MSVLDRKALLAMIENNFPQGLGADVESQAEAFADEIERTVSAALRAQLADLTANREYWRLACLEAQEHRDLASRRRQEAESQLEATKRELAFAREEAQSWRKRIADALGTGEAGDDLIAVARAAHSAEQELASLGSEER